MRTTFQPRTHLRMRNIIGFIHHRNKIRLIPQKLEWPFTKGAIFFVY